MNGAEKRVSIGSTSQQSSEKVVSGEFVTFLDEPYYKIQNADGLEPFFMSIVSSTDHWLFIASTGGLTAGRVNAEQALFPYYTVDKITENYENTGSKTILLITRDEKTTIWEPFSDFTRGSYQTERNIYKNLSSTAVVFEEVNLDLGIAFRYAWRTGEKFGFIKTSWITNNGEACQVEVLDGIQNILPANVSATTQNVFSNLLDAYKRSELEPGTGLGIFALNATMTDLAEPSESLLANTIGQTGLEQVDYLLSSQQLEGFRNGKGVKTEREVRGQRGAYFVHTEFELGQEAERTWHIFADVSQNHSQIVQRMHQMRTDKAGLQAVIEQDIADNQKNLLKLVAAADGVQLSSDRLSSAHHFSNVMFNIMRGGIFADQDRVDRQEFSDYIGMHSPALLLEQAHFFDNLPEKLSIGELQDRAQDCGSIDLIRLSAAYLPLTFSRRHGDPSRPWNRFQINVKKPDGSLRMDFEGNWRDIFQNWEALAWSYPEFVENMLSTFLNATTVDGYNPYRIMYSGVDWEIPEPDNPWANIGYWSDHQIIYLQKLMEISAAVHPGQLQKLLSAPVFSYTHVPYQIKPYDSLLQDPYNTINFDWDLQHAIEERVKTARSDGKLVHDRKGKVLHASLAEKLLTLLLAKLANFVPEGGIWMSTQRPEWNDANNALVGKGLSVVTLCYLHRFLLFCEQLFADIEAQSVPVRREVSDFCKRVETVLDQLQPLLKGKFSDEQRKTALDALGQAGSRYRWDFYENGLSGEMVSISSDDLQRFLKLARSFIEHSICANRRDDSLYHSYNTLTLTGNRAEIHYLYEMLEGQAAVLSSGLLSSEEALRVLTAMKTSRLYQAERKSYILYPDREIPGFLEKNTISPERIKPLALVKALEQAQESSLLVRDMQGSYHFNGQIRNIHGVNRTLETLKGQPLFAHLVETEAEAVRSLYEEIFHHREFTGRSSTFFAYEGLGSIYWHMVSKLLLAAGENAVRAHREKQDQVVFQALVESYKDIRKGLGFHKTPLEWGSFPTDPYSHSPKGHGAKQPGMTGQVKEDILSRMMEVGYCVRDGQIEFDPFMLDSAELLVESSVFTWLDVSGHQQLLEAPAGSLVYTLCQVPVVLRQSLDSFIEVYKADSSVERISGKVLDKEDSRHILSRDGSIGYLLVGYNR